MATPAKPGVSADLRVRVDQGACTGDGLCVQLAPSVFEFDVDGLAYVKDETGDLQTSEGAYVGVPLPVVNAVLDAADECPGTCIYVTRPDGTIEAGGPAD
ncbi:Ferredoxin [Frankia canadensis]|uniref:Ferredoxin n=1 Tax=Frankia canadensis TaxID=1836972 RepID=A0A2I2KPF4_9ACTN|nr:Ferredoxin [Frankia canadensis]SOU54820.1 Ferredoxin [Frankia canadensis]